MHGGGLIVFFCFFCFFYSRRFTVLDMMICTKLTNLLDH